MYLLMKYYVQKESKTYKKKKKKTFVISACPDQQAQNFIWAWTFLSMTRVTMNGNC